MPPKIQHRDVAGLLSRVRNFFLGRKHKTALRFADTVSPRTQPAPDIPRGPSQGLFANYYYMRDPRGQLKPVVDLMQEKKPDPDAKEKAAEAAEDAKPDCDQEDQEGADGKGKKLPTPGKVHSWEGPY
ncbi:NADH dehydrogenase [ubiquinone] 1 alpha subcomplex subunit 7 [Drosophila serrata]|uniref:NADH dehydrogenase [ubiquinone] 1 alpha subcomplex subunit 7 n=1 Tax=Drosophila serrata TaxID=7274 RepID=UPI000A1D2216|nr:NADH dehydrogenase [ubiquinone] 1 alpha subcomplex subunit 7 [Drosophila serrata]KAH8360602.1 hypothetical protein KR200_009928 [Drosophila serrata]